MTFSHPARWAISSGATGGGGDRPGVGRWPPGGAGAARGPAGGCDRSAGGARRAGRTGCRRPAGRRAEPGQGGRGGEDRGEGQAGAGHRWVLLVRSGAARRTGHPCPVCALIARPAASRRRPAPPGRADARRWADRGRDPALPRRTGERILNIAWPRREDRNPHRRRQPPRPQALGAWSTPACGRRRRWSARRCSASSATPSPAGCSTTCSPAPGSSAWRRSAAGRAGPRSSRRDPRQAADIQKYIDRFGVGDKAQVLRADGYRWAERWVPPPAGR